MSASAPRYSEPAPAGRGAGARLGAHVARLGAALLHPRALVRARLDGGSGGLAELLPWTLVAAGVASPGGLGQSVLIARTEPLAGLLRLAGVWSELVGPVLIGVVVVSLVAPRLSKSAVDGGDAFDAACFALVPLALMVSLGAIVEAAGIDARWLPNRTPRGTDAAALVGAALRYGWSFGVLGLTPVEARRRSMPPSAAEGS